MAFHSMPWASNKAGTVEASTELAFSFFIDSFFMSTTNKKDLGTNFTDYTDLVDVNIH